METATTDRCPEHSEHDPYERPGRKDYNYTCDVCLHLYHGAEQAGYFYGESKERCDEYKNAQYRIGPMSLEQFGRIREIHACNYIHAEGDEKFLAHIDTRNRIIYIDGDIYPRVLEKCKELDCVVQKRMSKPSWPSVKHVTYAVFEGFKKFWSTLQNRPVSSFFKTIKTE